MKTGQWRIGRWSCGQMSPKSTGLVQMGRLIPGRRRENHSPDNDPKHTSKKATKWFEDNNVEVMVWPAQFAELNPIEHLWVELKKTLKKNPRPAKGVHELWERVVEEWVPAETCQGLIESMPRRIQAVIKAKNSHTKY
jgi:DDE superfamily endonuclease